MEGLFARTDTLSTAAAFQLERTKVIQGNIANADTPGYKPKTLHFSKHLDDAMAMKRTSPKHIDIAAQTGSGLKTVVQESPTGYDRNSVNIDEEMAKLAESAIMYKSTVESMKKELSKLKLVISGR